jgi:hypothetical protein
LIALQNVGFRFEQLLRGGIRIADFARKLVWKPSRRLREGLEEIFLDGGRG